LLTSYNGLAAVYYTFGGLFVEHFSFAHIYNIGFIFIFNFLKVYIFSGFLGLIVEILGN
jgi:hypothetical protein